MRRLYCFFIGLAIPSLSLLLILGVASFVSWDLVDPLPAAVWRAALLIGLVTGWTVVREIKDEG